MTAWSTGCLLLCEAMHPLQIVSFLSVRLSVHLSIRVSSALCCGSPGVRKCRLFIVYRHLCHVLVGFAASCWGEIDSSAGRQSLRPGASPGGVSYLIFLLKMMGGSCCESKLLGIDSPHGEMQSKTLAPYGRVMNQNRNFRKFHRIFFPGSYCTAVI